MLKHNLNFISLLFRSQLLRLCNIHHMEQLDFRQQGALPNWLVYCDSFLWLGWHANLWVSNEWWLKQSSRPSAFQLWYITICPPVTHFESMDQRKGGKKLQSEEGSLTWCPVVIWQTDCYSVLNVRLSSLGLLGTLHCHLSILICRKLSPQSNKMNFWACHQHYCVRYVNI